VASWLFFRVALSSRINSDMLVVRALKNSQLTDGESHVIYGTGHKTLAEQILKHFGSLAVLVPRLGPRASALRFTP
jgi:hypothetical protein